MQCYDQKGGNAPSRNSTVLIQSNLWPNFLLYRISSWNKKLLIRDTVTCVFCLCCFTMWVHVKKEKKMSSGEWEREEREREWVCVWVWVFYYISTPFTKCQQLWGSYQSCQGITPFIDPAKAIFFVRGNLVQNSFFLVGLKPLNENFSKKWKRERVNKFDYFIALNN